MHALLHYSCFPCTHLRNHTVFHAAALTAFDSDVLVLKFAFIFYHSCSYNCNKQLREREREREREIWILLHAMVKAHCDSDIKTSFSIFYLILFTSFLS